MKRLLGAAVAATVLLCAGPGWAADTLKAVRTTMAADKAAQAKVDADQNARLQALEARLQAQTASPAIVTPPPVQPAPAYPKGVALAGLQGVYDARPGPVRPLTKTLPTAMPAWGLIVPGTLGTGAGATLADLDAWGYEVYFNGGAFGIDNARFGGGHGLYAFAAGHINGGGKPAQLALSNSLVDQTSPDSSHGAVLITGGPASSFTASKVSFLRAGGTNLNLDAPSALTDVYFDSPGQTSTAEAHTEGAHYFQGKHTVLRAFFDSRAGKPGTSHATGLVYVEAANGDVDVSLKDSILAGANTLGIAAPIQIFAKTGLHATLRMENVVLQAGLSTGAAQRYVVWGPNVTVTCHLCRDYDTGAELDGLLNIATGP